MKKGIGKFTQIIYLCDIVNEMDVIMNNATTEIEIRPTNKNVRFLENKVSNEKKYSLKEVFERGEKFLNDFYGTNLQLKY